jgi:PAS domain S-box-containing protein
VDAQDPSDAHSRADAIGAELEALVDTLFAAGTTAVALLDRDQRFVRVNDSFAALTGRTPAEHVGQTLTELLPEPATKLSPVVQRALDSGVASRNLEVSRPTTDFGMMPHAWQVHCLPVSARSGERLGVVLTVIDTSEQRRLEELRGFYLNATEVLASSLDYETTLNAVAGLAVPRFADWCAVDIVGASGAIHRVAVAARDPETEALVREMRERYPFDPEEQHGTPWVLRTGQAELLPEISPQDLATHATSEGHLDMLRRLGMIAVMRVPLIAGGRTLGVLTLGATRPGRRYDTANLFLVQILARRAALAVDNARLYRDAQEALRVREEFMTAVSHDLRTPLTPIKGFAQILSRRAQRMQTAEREGFLEGLATIEANAEKMQSLIGQLLDVAQMQSGRPLDLQRQATDLIEMVQRAITLLTQGHRNVQLRVDTLAGPVTGMWDATRIERVVSNLLSNATKYSPPEADIIVQITVESDAVGVWAVLTVQDFGIGIPAGDLPHVFEPYYRAANVGKAPGTGVGLAGAKQIVEHHGGTIAIDSTEGQGTTVTVRLPLEPSTS